MYKNLLQNFTATEELYEENANLYKVIKVNY